MPACISYGQSSYAAEQGETVLDCLSRHDVAVPHACRSGVCQSCLMQAVEGPIPEQAQKDLKPAYKSQRLFLACQCRPEADMRVRLPAADGLDYPAVIAEKSMLNANVLRLKLSTAAPLVCEPGQYVTLINAGGVARSYSIANDPAGGDGIELHIRLLPRGQMSEALGGASVGDQISLRGPAGSCFYVSEDGKDYPIVLAGTGTGLAPLYGILRKALASGHVGPIRLYHGALAEADLYLVDELRLLARAAPNFSYVPCVLNGCEGSYYMPGNIETIVLSELTPLAATRLFLCGAPEFVGSLRRKAFLAGIASKHIHADAFLPSRPASAAA